TLLHYPLQIVASVLGLFAIKGVIASALFKLLGLSNADAIEGGFLLGQGGEFAFVVLTLALAGNLLEPAVAQFMFLVVALGIFVTPIFAAGMRRVADTLQGELEETFHEPKDSSLQQHVILAGFGRVGEIIGRTLDELAVPYVAVDKNAQQVKKMREAGLPIFFGDASRHELMEKLGILSAKAIVITMDNPQAAQNALTAIRKYYADIPIIARAHNEKAAAQLKRSGATVVVPETLEAALQMAGDVLTQIGFAEDGSTAILQRMRVREMARHQEA
ncbi:MAG TPA: NAD-binding protein, partial [Pseudomonadales bacterium]|nr:NAD-binding protein [Pseudomonadales bacterium]